MSEINDSGGSQPTVEMVVKERFGDGSNLFDGQGQGEAPALKL
jgi:hypothetical protein